jgi:hypothetical protein
MMVSSFGGVVSLDAPEDLPKQAVGQVAFGQLEDEVPSMPDEASAGLAERGVPVPPRQTARRPRPGRPGGGLPGRR